MLYQQGQQVDLEDGEDENANVVDSDNPDDIPVVDDTDRTDTESRDIIDGALNFLLTYKHILFDQTLPTFSPTPVPSNSSQVKRYAYTAKLN